MNNTCREIPKRYNFFNNISLHILILFTILSILFVFIISKIESNAVNNEIARLIKNIKLTGKSSVKIDEKYFDYIIDQLKGTKNQLAEEINSKVTQEIWITVGFLIVIGVILNFIPIKFFGFCNNKLLGIIGELVVVFILIGVIEVLFFMNVALKYVPTKVSLIYEAVQDKLTRIIKS